MSRRDEVWTHTEDFVRLFRKVCKVLSAHDPMGIGNPRVRETEYDIEAAQIARLTLDRAADRADIERIAQQVFDAYFWPGSAARLDLVAEQVWKAYGWVRERREIKEPSRRALPAEAIGYVLDRLWLARGLEAPLTARLGTADWRAWTFADRDVPDARLASFHTGGHVFSGGSVADQVARIVAARARRVAGWWIVPDPMAKPSDAFLRDIAHVAIDDAVYYAVASPGATAVSHTWRQAASAAGVIGLLATRGFDTRDGLAGIAEALEFLVVEAYDGDGVIYLESSRVAMTTTARS